MVIDVIEKNKQFYIYGAQVVAYGAYVAIRHLSGQIPEGFVVSSLQNNPLEIEGIPVRTLDSIPRESLIVVGVTELVQKDVLPYLQKNGYENIFILTQHEEHLLMSSYYESIGEFLMLSNSELHQLTDMMLYEVRNHRDNPLTFPPELMTYEQPIQAGADLSEIRVAELLDNTGIHISGKNKQYCEMSATYWVWKNTDHAWKGIEHYRRHLLVSPEMLHDDIDAVLPLPYICYPNTMTQFRRFVGEEVLQALLKALQELHPDEYEDYCQILYGQYQYTYNLVCAKAEVFDMYCKWFFRITEYMETMADAVPVLASTRALSYVAEVLTNLYFMYHQDKLKIKHVEKAIYT